MEHCPSDVAGAALDGEPTEPDDGTTLNVIIAVSLDELDGLEPPRLCQRR